MVRVSPKPSKWLSQALAALTMPSQPFWCCCSHAGLCQFDGRDVPSSFLLWKSHRANFCLPHASSVHWACMGFKLSGDKHIRHVAGLHPSSICSTIWRKSTNICIGTFLQGHRLFSSSCMQHMRQLIST